MINTSNKVIYIKKGDQLRIALHKSIQLVSLIHQQESFIRRDIKCCQEINFIFSRLEVTERNYEKIADAIEIISMSKAFPDSERGVKLLSECVGCNLYEPNYEALKRGSRITLLYLHRFGAAVLPYKFNRPVVKWLDDLPDEISCYTRLEHALRAMDKVGTTGRDGKERNYHAERARRLFTLSFKMSLASSWFNISDITQADLKYWRYVSGKITELNGEIISPLPVLQLIEYLLSNFPGELSFTTHEIHENLNEAFKLLPNDVRQYLIQRHETTKNAEKFIKAIRSDQNITLTKINFEFLQRAEIREYLTHIKFSYMDSLYSWGKVQREFYERKKYGDETRLQRPVCLLNSYLFLYLPRWIFDNPGAVFKFPESPADFEIAHYDSRELNTEGRPLSFVEYINLIEIKENYHNLSNIRIFFDHVEQFQPKDLPPFHNPIQSLPSTRKYSEVTKNVFNSEIFPILLEFVQSLEVFCQYAELDPLFAEGISEARNNKKSKMLSLAEYGYVPCVRIDSHYYPINFISLQCLSIIEHNEMFLFNPASIRMALCQLETGIRTQGLQWLDASLYSKKVNRNWMKPSHLNRLYINTDKVHPEGLAIWVLNKVILLLDRQNNWRIRMIKEFNFTAYAKRLKFANQKRPRYPDILCLFASDTKTGAPYCDTAYAQHWAWLIFSFQYWFNGAFNANLRLTAYVPTPADSEQSYSWEAWEEKDFTYGIKEIEISKGVKYSPVNFRAFVTPHGARATFVTEFSHILGEEYLGLLTGQSGSVIRLYNKGGPAIRSKLQGALNNLEPAFQPMMEVSRNLLDSNQILKTLKDFSDKRKINVAVSKLGLSTVGDQSLNSRIEVDGLQIIARDSGKGLKACSTHLCPFGFQCPKEISAMFKGLRKCSLCPYAIFSVHHILRIEAIKDELRDSIELRKRQVIEHANLLNETEKLDINEELKDLAVDLSGWAIVSETLWMMISDPGNHNDKEFLTKDIKTVFEQIDRAEVDSGSSSDFRLRLDQVITLPYYTTPLFQRKMEKMWRFFLARDNKYLETLVPPSSVSLSLQLAERIRELDDDKTFDFGELVRLCNLDNDEWRETLLDLRSPNSLQMLVNPDERP
ncbi:hypothetical protein E8E95_14900 [Pseudomonas sp. BN414]|uniref:hypothetical protein n=1 Tax=Pseudomonas sp. BN414 TaxID=2567888 RepID=UPI002456D9C0|nr:hypothetical protein [Pseudomonas sp. BN414]MDH4567969.1 hypothetical protein [Pseudomonas sp. BN414]